MHPDHVAALGELRDLQMALLADIQTVDPHETGVDTPSSRRQYVRACFALVEGTTAALRRIAIADGEAGATPFSAGEMAMLRGETYELADSGEVRIKPQFQQLSRRLRFSFRAFARTYGIPFSLDVGGDGWQRFRKAVEIRNRLTHPKRPGDLEVSDADLEICGRAHAWYVAESIRVAQLVTQSLGDGSSRLL